MSLKQAFIEAIKNIDPAAYSDAGLDALTEYCLEQYEDPVGSAFSIYHDYTEYELFEDFNSYYDYNYSNLDEVRKETTVITIDGGLGFLVCKY